MWYVYILRCSDGSFYAGVTTDPERRIREHNAGEGGAYTRSRKPVQLLFRAPFKTGGGVRRRGCPVRDLRRPRGTVVCAAESRRPTNKEAGLRRAARCERPLRARRLAGAPSVPEPGDPPPGRRGRVLKRSLKEVHPNRSSALRREAELKRMSRLEKEGLRPAAAGTWNRRGPSLQRRAAPAFKEGPRTSDFKRR